MSLKPGRCGRRLLVVLLVAGVVLGTLPGLASAATRTGGTVVVGPDESVRDLTAVGGTVIVRGTVTGDLTAFGGNVLVTGNVTGDVSATAGNLRIAGYVGGNVSAAAGTVFVDPGAVLNGSLKAGAGTIVIGGTIRGDATLGGGSIRLESTASVGGDVEYDVGDDGEFVNEAVVGGSVVERDDLSIGGPGLPDVGGIVFGGYVFVVNLALGALLLLVFPGTSRRIAERVESEPLRTGGIGLLALIGVPVALGLALITIVGIPLSIAGFFLYVLGLWGAFIYGRYAVGMWLVGLADVHNRWAGLLVGMLALELLGRIPVLGGILNVLAMLLGLGAIAHLAYVGYRRRRGSDGTAGKPTGAVDAPDPAP